MKEIKDKIIVITGGTSGIGKYLSDRLSVKNTVINLSRSCESDWSNIPCDISVSGEVEQAFNTVRERFGRVDILINNAGYALNGAVELISDEEMERQMAVNFTGVFRCVKHALPLMGRGGRIINISSACAIFPLPFRAPYCASKAAVSMLSHSLREELRPYGISVTAVCPGDIATSFSKNRVRCEKTNDRYGERVAAAFADIDGREGKRMSVEYAGDKILKIVAKRRLRPTYIVGKKYKLLYAAYRIFPLSLILWATGKKFAGKE